MSFGRLTRGGTSMISSKHPTRSDARPSLPSLSIAADRAVMIIRVSGSVPGSRSWLAAR